MILPTQSAVSWLQRRTRMPEVEIPAGRWIELPGRGRTWLTDVPGPTPDAPTVVLLHALGCTGLLTWFPAVPELARTHRVITFDQRWHGHGITSEVFSLRECADDVAAVIDTLGLERPIVAGYSMGGVIAQRVWRQHPRHVGGLVLAATSDRFRVRGPEVVFHQGMELGMGSLRALSRARVAGAYDRRAAGAAHDGSDIGSWALAQFRSTSPWAVAEALSALGRHHARPWLGRVDVPTAVVVTTRDRLIPPGRQRALAARIPGATVHEASCGHGGCVLDFAAFWPAFAEAVRTVQARQVD